MNPTLTLNKFNGFSLGEDYVAGGDWRAVVSKGGEEASGGSFEILNQAKRASP